MAKETVRKNLVDAINELTKLLEVCKDPNERFELRIKIRELFQRLDRVIVATLDSETPEFSEAVESLKALTKKAKEARAHLDKVADTINAAGEAINKVEKLVKNIAGVLAIL